MFILNRLVFLSIFMECGFCQDTPSFHYRVDSTRNSSCVFQGENYCNNCMYICGSLMEAITSSQAHALITIEIDNSSHIISDNSKLMFQNKRSISFLGDGTQIFCEPQSGLYFRNINNVTMSNIMLTNCSTERNYTTRQSGQPATYLAAVVFSSVNLNLNLINVSIFISAGETAAALYNVQHAIVSNCTFDSSNEHKSYETSYPSSALLVELTYYKDNEVEGNIVNNAQNFQFDLSNSRILHHRALGTELEYYYTTPNGTNYNYAGKGGGMAVLVKGNCNLNSVNIENTHFIGNVASQGSALYVAFMDSAYDNHVIIRNSTFDDNGEYTSGNEDSPVTFNAGGAIAIDNWVASLAGRSSDVSIQSSQFVHNTAQMGGAVFLNSVYSVSIQAIAMMVSDSSFTNNSAQVGSALYTLVSHANLHTGIVNITVHNTSFSNNTVASHNPVGSGGYGTVYSHMVGIDFSCVCFSGNSGSAVVMIDARARFAAGLSEFHDNTGIQGGAVSLLGSSYISLASGAMLIFSENRAVYQGGAIFKQYLEHIVHGSQYSSCFFQYESPYTDPNEWNVRIIFMNNMLSNNKSNSIHSTSMLPCKVGSKYIVFGPQWNYSDVDMSSRITTNFASYKTYTFDKPSISPGRHFSASIDLQDEFNQTIDASSRNFILELNGGTTVTSLDRIQINGTVNENVHLVMDSTDKPSLHVDVNVSLSSCPLGFFNIDGYSCSCNNNRNKKVKNYINCTNEKYVATLIDNGWLGNYSDDIYVAPCPLYYCRTYTSGLELPHTNTTDLSSSMCAGNRTGLLCSQCIKGFKPAINSWRLECVNCTNIQNFKNILLYISVVYIPYAIMMSIIILFNIQLSAGPPSTLVMFSQMVITTFDASIHGLVATYPERALNTYRYVYGPLNLDFIDNIIPSFCFPFCHSILDIVSLNYFLVIFPMTIILVSIVLKVVGKRTRVAAIEPVQRFCKVLKNSKMLKFAPKSFSEVIILATSSVITLSFLKICLISFMALNKTKLYSISNTDKRPHLVTFDAEMQTESSQYRIYQALAVIFQILALSFITLLLDYPLRLIEYCIHKSSLMSSIYPEITVHSFVFSFNGPYKKPYKIFAGLSFLMRYIFVLMFVRQTSNYTKFTLQSISCFVMILLIFFCWPYKNVKHNYIDLFLLSNLIILNGLGFYQYVAFFLSSHRKTKLIFSFQYIFTVAPLICLAAYLLYKITQRKHDKWREDAQYTLSGLLKKWSPHLHRKMSIEEHSKQEDTEVPSSSKPAAKSCRRMTSPISRRILNGGATPLHWSMSNEIEVDAATRNVPVTVIGVEDKHEGEATTYQTSHSEGFFLRTEWNPAVQYGSINSSLERIRQKSRK